MSENELLNAFEDSKPFKDSKEINKENQNDDEIIRDLRFLYEPDESYDEPRKKRVLLAVIMLNTKAVEILKKYLLLKVILIR